MRNETLSISVGKASMNITFLSFCTQAQGMPISPKPFVLQLFDEVILPKLAHQYFKDGEEFYNKLR